MPRVGAQRGVGVYTASTSTLDQEVFKPGVGNVGRKWPPEPEPKEMKWSWAQQLLWTSWQRQRDPKRALEEEAKKRKSLTGWLVMSCVAALVSCLAMLAKLH